MHIPSKIVQHINMHVAIIEILASYIASRPTTVATLFNPKLVG